MVRPVAVKRSKTRRDARPSPRASPGRSVPLLLLAAVLASVGFWAYSTSFAGVLVLDDVRALAQNPTIRTLWPLSTPLSPPGESTVAGRPIANLSFAINFAVAPDDVRDVFAPGGRTQAPVSAERFLRNIWGYHALNLLIHVAAALTLFGIVRRTLLADRLRSRLGVSATGLAFVTALVWLVHPLQTAAVTYLVQRVESLMGFFYLLTLYCAIRTAGGVRARAWTIGAAVSCALSMATKEVMVTAPIMVWLWYRVFGSGEDRRRRSLFIGLAASWVVFAALVWHEHRGPSIDFAGETVWRYLLTQAEVVTHYLRLAVIPSPLVFFYTWPLATSLEAVGLQATVLTALVILTILGIVQRHPLGFGGAWFFLILAPTSSIVPIVTEVAAEHRMYLPLASLVTCAVVGVFLTGQSVMTHLTLRVPLQRRVGFTAATVLTASVVTIYSTGTRARNRDYRSAESLWGDTVVKQPANQRARVAYGEALSDDGRYSEAEAQYQMAVDLAPEDPVARVRLGGVQAALGKLDEAIPHFERALMSRPDDVDAHRALGLAYTLRRQDARAVRHLERAIAAHPNDPFLLGQFATILSDSRDLSVRDGRRAVDLAERAARATSRQDPMTLEILSVALAAAGRLPDAAATAAEALNLARRQGDQVLTSRLENRLAAYTAVGSPSRR